MQEGVRRLLARYRGAAPSVFRRLITPLDVRRSTLNESEHGLLRELVEQSAQHGGPIIEIGTLIGATTTRMALWKSAGQRIITVDSYRRNPWGLSPELHYALTAQVLFFVVQTGQVEQVQMDKSEFYRIYNGAAPALVLLDAVHTYEETRSIFSGRAACARQSFVGTITASGFLALFERLMNSAGQPNCVGACGHCESVPIVSAYKAPGRSHAALRRNALRGALRHSKIAS
jgi:hypothetical protein